MWDDRCAGRSTKRWPRRGREVAGSAARRAVANRAAGCRARRVLATLALGSAAATAGCGEVARTGEAPVRVIVSRLEAASGADPATFSGVLYSDVETVVERTNDGGATAIPTAFPDPGQAELRLAFKDPGAAAAPSDYSSVTITRYRVAYRRTDGRNVPGVDVPYAFEGATTRTIDANAPALVGLELVRVQAKHEPPLRNLRGGGGALAISTIAEVTFYGRDMSGRDVSATASISIVFADWADPR
jgi:hypothetical protein